MDKKRIPKIDSEEDIKGFEEYIEGQAKETRFLPRQTVSLTKKETAFEHLTFLATDAERLNRINKMLGDKLPFTKKFNQGMAIIKHQRDEVTQLKAKIFGISDQVDSNYRKSLNEVFNSFFDSENS